MKKTVLRGIFIIVAGLVSGIVGLVIGILFGGNYAEQFMFNGVRGYEATGQIGLLLGTSIGLFSAWWFLFKRKVA
ncbi:MAG: hypothetical protein WCK35_15370 [Chloroflexota bacterium]